MSKSDSEKIVPWFLTYEASGQPVIRWGRVLGFGALLLLFQTFVMWFMTAIVGTPRRAFAATSMGVFIIPMYFVLMAFVLVTHDREMMKYRGETPRLRFNLRVVFLIIFGICLWLAVTRLETQRIRREHEQRNKFTQQFNELVGTGKARYSGNTNELMIVVEHSEFDDEDFQTLVKLLEQSPDAAYIYYLDLTGTKVTDASLSRMSDWSGLKFLILDGTAVTNDGVRRISELPDLRALSVGSTSVSTEVKKEIRARLKERY